MVCEIPASIESTGCPACSVLYMVSSLFFFFNSIFSVWYYAPLLENKSCSCTRLCYWLYLIGGFNWFQIGMYITFLLPLRIGYIVTNIVFYTHRYTYAIQIVWLFIHGNQITRSKMPLILLSNSGGKKRQQIDYFFLTATQHTHHTPNNSEMQKRKNKSNIML